MNSDLTLAFVTFHSDLLIENILKKINKNYQILIIENSLNIEFKKKIEKNFENVKVIIPENNNGVGSGINLALKNSKTKFLLFLSVDLKIENNTIDRILEEANNIEDFSIIVPNLKNYSYSDEFYLEKNYLNNCSKMKMINGAIQLFNIENINKVGLFDENIFLYYEEDDLCKRCLDKNLDIIKINNIEVEHIGSSSISNKFKNEIELSRNWHLMWSSFYFYKKHYGYFYGVKKIIRKFFSAFFKIILYSVIRNDIKKKIYLMRFLGIVNSLLGKKSYYRPKIDN